jgi:hypothetical protein
MRTITKNVYKFDELTHEVQQKVIDSYKNDDWLHDHCLWEGERSLEAYCEHFNVKLKDYFLCPFNRCYAQVEVSNKNFRGLKLKDCEFMRDYMPTGYCLDQDFFLEFYNEFKSTGDALRAFKHGLEYGIDAIKRDCEYQYEDENILARIESNDHEYFEDGELFTD